MRLDGRSPTDDEIESRIAEEVRLAEGCSSVIAVSDAEGAQFSRRNIPRVYTLGHAAQLCPTPNNFDQRHGLLFIGALPDARCPNADGLIWFCGEVLPRLQRRLGPNLQLLVAGVNNLHREGPLANDSVIFLGVVPDLKSLYNQAKVFVAPVRFGAGIPVKICDAAAHGLPVVATTALATQLNWQHERELLAADNAQAFADECMRLHRDASLWQSIRSSALARMHAEGSVEAFSIKLKAIMDGALGGVEVTNAFRP